MMTRQAGMHGLRVATLALCAFAVSVIPAMAQDNGAAPAPQGQQQGMGEHRDPAQMQERQIERLTKKLDLTPDQVTKVKAIDDAQRTQMMALRDDTSTPREEKRGKMMAIRQDTETKIRAALTDDQKSKYDEMLAKQKEKAEKRHGDGGQDAPPPPPAQ